jgi:hypothetical protein
MLSQPFFRGVFFLPGRKLLEIQFPQQLHLAPTPYISIQDGAGKIQKLGGARPEPHERSLRQRKGL